MRLLCVTTKPPWPTLDGGRLVAYNTLRALAETGCELTLVSPYDPRRDHPASIRQALAPFCRVRLVEAPLRSKVLDAARAIWRRRPMTIARHALEPVRRAVAEEIAADPPTGVLVEHLQALESARPAREAGIPIVLRAHNVESDLWRLTADDAQPLRRPLLRGEARRLAAWEGTKVRETGETGATLTLSRQDAARLAELAGGAGRLESLAVPFDVELPSADRPLPGAPAVVLFGSGGWRPNRDAATRFVRRAWPRVHAAVPGARLHLFGLGDALGPADAAPGMTTHAAPESSRDVFAPGAILAVPLEVGSGVRIKILEAWARGTAVIASTVAARGLDAVDGEHLLLADDVDAWVDAVRRLADEPGLAARLVDAGRRRLRERHAFGVVGGRLVEIFAELAG